MKNIANFVEQLEKSKAPFNIFIYASNNSYSPLDAQRSNKATQILKNAIERYLQVVVEMNGSAFLLLSEVHMAVPINFQEYQITAMTESKAA
ncbi:hypothetical protein C9J48_22205 [Photobacterium profundum]|uniref:Uncharacterized protein n=1 Tax=Photobacterium profundum 3TCK TaxID=314280 RepID=Q1YZG2_9GAMM|nr:hypothetical protein [Photobacterium profundum]EAS41614.1 hypothetical protein P3TCK_19365 [Photobacterium profundum 3TCK]PSV59704.1 hypothetical protein C9J48_22205 [Photobacterium profundum]